MDALRVCAILPVYNHGSTACAVVDRLRQLKLPCIVVDDGSEPGCAAQLQDIAASHADVTVVKLSRNGGKGAAVSAGLRAAQAAGFSHALQIDADGQHDTADVPLFIAAAVAAPDQLICGRPVFDDSVPRGRLYGRYLTHALVWLNTLSFEIVDSMCGFRLYPLAPVLKLLDETTLGLRMDFDIEVLVKLKWREQPMRWIPTRVQYPADGVSHFRLWEDNRRISTLHAKLFLGMLVRAPRLLWRKWQ